MWGHVQGRADGAGTVAGPERPSGGVSGCGSCGGCGGCGRAGVPSAAGLGIGCTAPPLASAPHWTLPLSLPPGPATLPVICIPALAPPVAFLPLPYAQAVGGLRA